MTHRYRLFPKLHDARRLTRSIKTQRRFRHSALAWYKMKAGHARCRTKDFQFGRTLAFKPHCATAIGSLWLPGHIVVGTATTSGKAWFSVFANGMVHGLAPANWLSRGVLGLVLVGLCFSQGCTLISSPIRSSMSHARSYSSPRRWDDATMMA